MRNNSLKLETNLTARTQGFTSLAARQDADLLSDSAVTPFKAHPRSSESRPASVHAHSIGSMPTRADWGANSS